MHLGWDVWGGPILAADGRLQQLGLENGYRIARYTKAVVSEASAGRTGPQILRVFVISPSLIYFFF